MSAKQTVLKPTTTPATPEPGGGKSPLQQTPFEQTMYQRNLFLSMALNMTWQLALVVIIPIVGGFKLDKHFNTSPWLAVVGFVVAALGVAAVLVRIVRVASVKAQIPEAKK